MGFFADLTSLLGGARSSAARRRPRRERAGESGQSGTRQRGSRRPDAGQTEREARAGAGYPGDFTGPFEMVYAPVAGERPDPGEVVWTWVPYEEDHARGKDRPVLLVGRDGDWLLGLPLTSKDHDRDAAQEASQGRHWVDVGRGAWDSRGRESEARVDRVVRVDPRLVRRGGDRVSRDAFARVAAGVEKYRA